MCGREWLYGFLRRNTVTSNLNRGSSFTNSGQPTNKFHFRSDNGIIVVSLPTNTSNRLQPLDITFFSSLTAAYSQEYDQYIKSHHFADMDCFETVVTQSTQNIVNLFEFEVRDQKEHKKKRYTLKFLSIFQMFIIT